MKKQTNESQSASFFRELGIFMKPYAGKYVLSVILSVLSVGCNLGSYAFAGFLAAMFFQSDLGVQQAVTTVLGVIVCKLLHVILLNTSTWISHHAAYPTLRDIRTALADKMLRIPMGYFEENGSGRIKSMLVDQVEGMEKTLAHMLPELTANLLGPAALLIWMFILDWRLALCSVVWIILGFMASSGMMKGYAEKYNGQLESAKNMNQSIVEYVGGIEVVKNFGRLGECYQKYQDTIYGYASYNAEWVKDTQLYSSAAMAISPFSIFPVLIGGLIFFYNGTLDAGTLLLAILLTLGIFGPLMQAMSYFDQVAQMGTQAKEIKSILEWPELKRSGQKRPKSGDVKFSHVNFSYTASEDLVLKNISLYVPAHTMLALVGPSGSGKSTIAKLLAGYWDPVAGEISIGGTALTEISQEQLNRQIAYVEQETFLFDKTILENIRMGNPTATDDEVMGAAAKAGCDSFIRSLPEGYATRVGLAGSRLSGGERQRIAIARAMLKDAPIMILDEATASSDPENEASIQTALSAAAQGKTLIVVAHRLATVVQAQQIAFIKDGQIQSIGTHTQLLENCPEYAAMWKLSEEG